MTGDPAVALAESVRRLIDATIRTLASDAAVESATRQIDSATAQLTESQMPGSFGMQDHHAGPHLSGNVMIGDRNAVAPPLTIHRDQDGSVWTGFELGAAYEGPAGHVHGGVCAMVLDHVLGAAAHQPGRPAVTGTLTLRYRRGTPLSRPLRAEARILRVEGVKTFVVGHITDGDEITVQADGVFIFPKQQLSSPSTGPDLGSPAPG